MAMVHQWVTGDITIQTGKITDKYVDEDGRHMVAMDIRMANQLGSVLATAKTEVELPARPA